MVEYVVIAIVLFAALAFAGWRVWRTLRVSQGKGDAHACGKCPAGR